MEAEGFGWELFKNYLLAKEKFKNDVKPSDAKKIENTLKNQFDRVASKVQENHKIEENKAAQERKDALKELAAKGQE